MKRIAILSLTFVLISSMSFAQTNPLERLNTLIGEWSGVGSGFGNNKSNIESSFKLVMNGSYLEINNESQFEPTERNPKGEHHIDKGYVSFDKARKLIVFRQFNNEGYINQYVLNDSLSNDQLFVFETETIENFVPGGKVQWIIKLISEKEIETTFNVSFPNKDYTCFGVNTLIKKE